MSKTNIISNCFQEQPKTLFLATYALGLNFWPEDDYFQEFENLVSTAGINVDKKIYLKLRVISQSHFLSKGKLEEIARICQEEQIERIVCSSSLTGLQHRNLEDATETELIDRTELILNIFKKSAATAEGKLQVEIAEIKIAKTRMAGIGLEMGQQQAGDKSRGPGETEKEYISRNYARLIQKAERKLKELKSIRLTQRKQRLKSRKPMISLVGYTNAGKSSLMNLLSKSDVLVQDKLFATLDTTTREVFLEESFKKEDFEKENLENLKFKKPKTFLLSDTVGFISQLPHHLVEAFKSTLDELNYADLLLEVIDSSNKSWREQMEVVQETLSEINIKKPKLYVFNKIDKLSKENLAILKKSIELMKIENENFVFTQTKSKDGIKDLLESLKNRTQLWG